MARSWTTKYKTPGKKKPYKWVEQAVVISAMRRAFRRFPAFKQALDAAKQEYFITSKTGKAMRRVHWKCASCGKMANNKEKAVDHIIPVVDPINGFQSYDDYAKRLFCSIDNLQILCSSCHKVKSLGENKIRRSNKKSK